MRELSSSGLAGCSMVAQKDQVSLSRTSYLNQRWLSHIKYPQILPSGNERQGLAALCYKVLYKAKLQSYKAGKASYLILAGRLL